MIAEPYIIKYGSKTGEITWYEEKERCSAPAGWQRYVDFEMAKLKELDNVKTAYCGFQGITISCKDCYWVLLSRKDCADNKCTFPWQTLKGDRAGEKQHCHHYGSADLIGYKPSDYDKDSESSRLLKRAEFLKAVCEKEGVEWLPNEKCHYCETGDPCVFDQTCPCPCKCHCACHGNPQDPCLCNGVECICKPEEPNVYKGDMKSVVNKFIDENKKPFWKGNKRREGTEHLT